MNNEAFDPYQEWLGIGPHERPIDYYRLLGIERFTSDAQRIAAAADERMRHVRTFQTGPRGVHSQKLLNELARAKLKLLNPETRAEYDRRLRESAEATALFAQEDDLDLPAPVPISVPPPVPPRVPPPVPAAPAATAPASRPTVPATGTPMISRPTRPFAAARRRKPKRRVSVWAYVALFLCFLITVVLAVVFWQFIRDKLTLPPSEDDAARTTAPVHVVHGNAQAQSDLDEPTDPGVIRQDAAGRIEFAPRAATIHGASPQLINEGAYGTIADWSSSDDWIEWKFFVRKGGVFRARITYATFAAPEGARWQIELDDQKIARDMRDTSQDAEPGATDEVIVHVREPGTHTLAVRILDLQRDFRVAVQSLEFVPFHPTKRDTDTDPGTPLFPISSDPEDETMSTP